MKELNILSPVVGRGSPFPFHLFPFPFPLSPFPLLCSTTLQDKSLIFLFLKLVITICVILSGIKIQNSIKTTPLSLSFNLKLKIVSNA